MQVAAVGSAIAILAETAEEVDEAKARAATSNGSAASSAPPAPVAEAAPPPPPAAAAPSPPPPAQAPAVPVVSSHPAAEGGRIVATPYAKKLAKQFKVHTDPPASTSSHSKSVPDI